jgi:hypothetical protein
MSRLAQMLWCLLPSILWDKNTLTVFLVAMEQAGATATDVIGVALDIDGGTITFYLNGVSQGAITLYSRAQ